MENTLLLMKVIAVAHGVTGIISGMLTASPEIQAEVVYKYLNPLVFDLQKLLTYAMCFCLVLCGCCPWFKPAATPTWAWIALGFHLLSGTLEATTQRRRGWCWRCMATGITLKVIAASVLTYLASVYEASGNG
jgi:hypothetical protein